jgi:hypothetical protein
MSKRGSFLVAVFFSLFIGSNYFAMYDSAEMGLDYGSKKGKSIIKAILEDAIFSGNLERVKSLIENYGIKVDGELIRMSRGKHDIHDFLLLKKRSSEPENDNNQILQQDGDLLNKFVVVKKVGSKLKRRAM